MDTKVYEWIAGGVIGATSYALLQSILLPLLADWIFYKTQKIRGRWNATIWATTPDGQNHNNSEVVFVRQLGNRIWGWTEIGAEPLLPGLEEGNKFSGKVEGTTIIVTFRSRNSRSPHNGVFIGVIESERLIKGIDIARYNDVWPIRGEFKLEKVSA